MNLFYFDAEIGTCNDNVNCVVYLNITLKTQNAFGELENSTA